MRRIVEALRATAHEMERDTFGSEIAIDKMWAAQLLDAFRALKLSPPMINNSVGLDGVTYGIRFSDGMMSSLELSWWHKAPEGFGEVLSFTEKAISEFETRLPQSTHALDGPPWVQ